jgi:hypothetical protein
MTRSSFLREGPRDFDFLNWMYKGWAFLALAPRPQWSIVPRFSKLMSKSIIWKKNNFGGIVLPCAWNLTAEWIQFIFLQSVRGFMASQLTENRGDVKISNLDYV